MAIGAGTTHSVSTDATSVEDASATWINTAKIKDMSAPEESRSTSEDSYIDEESGYSEFVSGMKDAGEMSLTLKWNETDVGQVALNNAFESTDGDIYGRITFKSGTTFTYKGVLTGRGIEIPKNETITRTYKVKISGAPKWV